MTPKTSEKMNLTFQTNEKLKPRTKHKKLNFSYSSNFSETSGEKVKKMKTEKDLDKNDKTKKISCFSIL